MKYTRKSATSTGKARRRRRRNPAPSKQAKSALMKGLVVAGGAVAASFAASQVKGLLPDSVASAGGTATDLIGAAAPLALGVWLSGKKGAMADLGIGMIAGGAVEGVKALNMSIPGVADQPMYFPVMQADPGVAGLLPQPPLAGPFDSERNRSGYVEASGSIVV